MKLGSNKSISFRKWCYDNLSKDEADKIMLQWDYKLNITKKGKIISPDDISYSSNGINGKGYWFKCLDHPEHKSEQKRINRFTSGQKGSLSCIQCTVIATTHPNWIKYLINKEDAYRFSFGSQKYRCNVPIVDIRKRNVFQTY